MQPVLAVALTAMHQDMDRLDRVALNLANASTPGYKREIAAASPFVDALAQAASTAPIDIEPVQERPITLIDGRPGTVKSTGQPLDVALTGEGFFEVRTDTGPAYTRDGSFHTDEHGRLVTAQGHVVAGRDGDITLSSSTPSIDSAGRITEDENTARNVAAVAPHIKVVRFEDAKGMQRLGNGLLSAGAGISTVSDADVRLRQGALENSNVSTMQEMVQLMQTMRHFESVQKVAQGYDEALGTAIHKLGDLS
jgi:flagellar basal-body rod protein FlgG